MVEEHDGCRPERARIDGGFSQAAFDDDPSAFPEGRESADAFAGRFLVDHLNVHPRLFRDFAYAGELFEMAAGRGSEVEYDFHAGQYSILPEWDVEFMPKGDASVVALCYTYLVFLNL